MSLIPSASTIYTTAYITEKGRNYLFGVNKNGKTMRFDSNEEDLFKPELFSIYDSDVNYSSYEKLGTGELTDLSGRKDESCINGVVDSKRQNALFFGEAKTPSINFENCRIEINEGESIDINVVLSFYLFTIYERSVLLSVDFNSTTLEEDEYSLSLSSNSNIIFPSGYKEIPFTFSSTTNNSLFVNESKSVFFKLTNFIESVPGDCTTLELVIKGSVPLPVVANFTSRQEKTSFARSASINVPGDSRTEKGEFYMSLNLPENFKEEPNVNLFINQTEGVNSFNGGFSFKIRDPQTGTIIIPEEILKNSVEQGTSVPINFNSSNDKQFILIEYEVPALGLGSETVSSVGFLIESAFSDTEIGDFSEYSLSLINPKVCKPSCETPNYFQGFSNELNWKQLSDNPFQKENFSESNSGLYYVQSPVVSPWTFVSQGPGFANPLAEIRLSYEDSNKTEDLYEVFRDSLVSGDIDIIDLNDSGYITPIIYQNINSVIKGKHSMVFELGSYAESGGLTGDIPLERFLIDTIVYVVVKKNGQWKRVYSKRVPSGVSIDNVVGTNFSYEYDFNGEEAIGIYALGLNVYHTYGGVNGCDDCEELVSPSLAYLSNTQSGGNLQLQLCVSSSCPETSVPTVLQWRGLKLNCAEPNPDC